MKILSNNSYLGNVAVLLFFALVVIGENIITVVFHIPYKDYLQYFYIISLFLIIWRINDLWRTSQIRNFMIVVALIYLYGIINHRGAIFFPKDLVSGVFLFLCSPKEQRYWRKIFILLFLIFFIECFIALWERLNSTFLLGWIRDEESMQIEQTTTFDFRSTALLGHPLLNALIMTTIMTFVLFSRIKTTYKYLAWTIGFISILCFDGRASMIINVSVFVLHLALYSFSKNNRSKFKTITLGIVISGSLYYLYNVSLLGRRLKMMGIMDSAGSTEARIYALDIIDYMNSNQIIFGVETSMRENLRQMAGVDILENFWIAWTLSYGLIVLLPFVIIVTFLVAYYYKGYNRLVAFISALTFVVLASTNNSLQWSYVPLYVFLVCIYIFNPKNINFIIPHKYLDYDTRK